MSKQSTSRRAPPVLSYLPIEVLPKHEAGGRAQVVRTMLALALSQELAPLPTPRTSVRYPINLEPEQLEQVLRIAGASGLAPGRVVGGLIYALHIGSSASPKLEDVPSLVTTGLRNDQIKVLQELAPHIRSGKVAVVESGTGTGKSRMIAHAAAYALALRDGGHTFDLKPLKTSEQAVTELRSAKFVIDRAKKVIDRVAERQDETGLAPHTIVITAPTVATMSHLISEYRKVARLIDPSDRYSSGAILGRGQYVSRSALQEILDCQESPHPGVIKWLDEGMPAGLTHTTMALKDVGPFKGLMDDLRAIVGDGDFPVHDAALSPFSSPSDASVYDEICALARDKDIVFATHAMLANDSALMFRDYREVLPRPLVLLVDEAHLIEQSFANSAAASVSFTRLRAILRTKEWINLRLKSEAEKSLAAVNRAYTALQAIPEDVRLPIADTGNHSASIRTNWRHADECLTLCAKALDTMATKASGREHPSLASQLTYIKGVARALHMVVAGSSGILQFSPTRRYPSITVGPTDVRSNLYLRWETTPAVALFSGTMLYRGAAGAQLGPTIQEFALPPERTVMTNPLHPAWLLTSPSLHIPNLNEFERLIPPSASTDDKTRSHEADLHHWLRGVARAVKQLSQDAAGGTLILMTGYNRCTILNAELLALCPPLSSRTILQTAASGFAGALARFRTMSAAGQSPIWIATGPSAWASLDLSDGLKPVSDDFLLTDLVIPALPFGLNKSTTHVQRTAVAGFVAEVAEAQRVFRQGLGRLIRREGLIKRRIWVLDGRLHHPGRRAMTADFWRILEAYPKVNSFKLL